MKSVAPLSLSITSSRRLRWIQWLAHGVAAAAVLAAAVPPWLMAVLLLSVIASLAHRRRPAPVKGLLLNGEGGLEIVDAGGAATPATVHPHTLVLSFLVVLLYRSQGRLHSVTLLADSLAAEDFRQLRLWLRWRATQKRR